MSSFEDSQVRVLASEGRWFEGQGLHFQALLPVSLESKKPPEEKLKRF